MASKHFELDFGSFPSGTVNEYTTFLCLACIFDIFTKQLGLAPRTAYSEIKRHTPTIAELTAREAGRPYFDSSEKNPHCPFCDSSKRWHARFDISRIEGGKHTDALRRALVKTLPRSDDQFLILEEKSTHRRVFFEWLEMLGCKLEFDTERWLIEATHAYLERVAPKTDWAAAFDGVWAVRRSNRLVDGWEREGGKLYLASPLYNDSLFLQYLVSRSHQHGGITLEGRLTLAELIGRMRHRGFLELHGITERDQIEVLDKLVDHLTGGDAPVKLFYIVDRRDFLDKVKTVYAKYAA